MQKKTITYQEAKKRLAGLLLRVGKKHSIAKVFLDCMEMNAIAISSRVDKANYQRREARYLDIVRAYDKDEIDAFCEAMAMIVLGLQAAAETGQLRDMLGELYGELGMNDNYKAQMFTPQDVANLMGHLTYQNDNPQAGGRPEGSHSADEHQESKSVSLYDGTVGSGVLVLGFINALMDQGIRYHGHVVVEAMDIDPVCVHMCYIQFSLYGIAAKVLHGNTLLVETFDTWYTPMYILRGYGAHIKKPCT